MIDVCLVRRGDPSSADDGGMRGWKDTFYGEGDPSSSDDGGFHGRH
jgi:hypothetical protein